MTEIPASAQRPHVLCPRCGRKVEVRDDGRLRRHLDRRKRTPWCVGSELPAELDGWEKQ